MNSAQVDAFSDGGGNRSVLVVVGGLPATGKTTVSRAAAGRTGAACLRIDTIEQALSEFADRAAAYDGLRHASPTASGTTSPMPLRATCFARDCLCSRSA
jgi:hypothetical protein